MISLLQLEFLLLGLSILIFFIKYWVQKKYKKIKDLIWDCVIEGITLNSGVIILLYLTGRLFNIEYLSSIDEYALYVGLLIGGLAIVGGSVDKLIKKRRNKNAKKT